MNTDFKTADLSDNFSSQTTAADSIFKDYGAKTSFYGEMVTLKLFEDNSLVRQLLSTNGKGKVLVVDGGASLRCALLGDLLAELAIRNQWEGLVINGCIRDSETIRTMPLGVKALGTHPLKTEKRNEGQTNIKVKFAGTEFHPGKWIYCDADGILISDNNLLAE